MRTKVTENGVTVPRELLEGIDEVEIRRENDLVVLVPVDDQDPILKLGTHPVKTGAPDAADNHDEYIYGTDG